MTKIIKKNNKYYQQEIDEIEITLKELEDEKSRLEIDKKSRLERETKMFDEHITEVQNQINQLKLL